MNIFQNIGNAVKNFFSSSPVKAFEQFLKDLFTAEVKQLQGQLINLALAEVQALINNQSLQGPNKASIARLNLINAAKNAGIQATTSDINLAIEMAYTSLKNANAGITINGQPAPVNNQGNVNG